MIWNAIKIGLWLAIIASWFKYFAGYTDAQELIWSEITLFWVFAVVLGISVGLDKGSGLKFTEAIIALVVMFAISILGIYTIGLWEGLERGIVIFAGSFIFFCGSLYITNMINPQNRARLRELAEMKKTKKLARKID